MEKTSEYAGICYDFISDKFLLSLGEFPDITAAFYNGNFEKSLVQAQKDKHAWVLEGIDYYHGQRILDIGCGWGPMLKAIEDRDGKAVGLTISQKQAQYCQNNSLDARLEDWKLASPDRLGRFDGIVSIGAFEHFCSLEEYQSGRQEEIYKAFFKFCHDLLSTDGTLFLQTMTWGNRVPHTKELDHKARYGSHSNILGNIMALSSWWPPESIEQIIQTAKPQFDLVEENNGREDYIRTMLEWKLAWDSVPLIKKVPVNVKTSFSYWTVHDFRRGWPRFKETAKHQLFREAFINRILDHERMFFKKK